MFYPMFTDFVCFQFYFRDYVRRLEQRTLVSLLSTLTKCAETHIRRLRRCPFYNVSLNFMCYNKIYACPASLLLRDLFLHNFE